MMQETVTVLESVEELPLRANAQMHLGMQYNHIGQFAEGIRLLEQSVPVLRSLNYRYGMAFGELSLGLSYAMSGQYARGAALLQSAYQVAEQGGFMREAVVSLHVLGMVAVVQGRLEQALDHFSQGVERYRSMQFAGELGMGLGGLSLAQAAAGQVEAARENLREALEIAEQTRNMSAIFLGSPAMVFYFARCGPLETAVLLHRLLIRIPFHHNSLWYADVIGDEMDAHWQALSPQQQAAIDASLQAHTPFTILPQVLSLLANQS
jgi:tetratricopeptide (TPR) repeat protein